MAPPKPVPADAAAGPVRLLVDGRELRCAAGSSVAGALLSQGRYMLRRSPNGRHPRGPFCMMGACQECAVRIDGAIRRACQTEAADGMVVELRGAGFAGPPDDAAASPESGDPQP